MRIKNETLEKYSPIIWTAGISCVLFCVLLFFRGFYPFGNGSVMLTDMYDECVPALYRFYDIITGHKNIFYEFQASGGINLYTETINEICNPFNYVLLLWKRENIYLAVNVILMLYVAAAACSAHFFLIRVWEKPSKLNLLLSLCYAFSGYFAYNFQILRWMILPVIFPIFLLSGLRLLREQKGGMYAFLLGYQIVLSVQHGFMTLLFCLFTSGIWMYCIEDKKTRKNSCFYVAFYTAAGLLFSAVCLLPTIFTLFTSSRAGANGSYFKVFVEHGLRDLFERLFQFCHPVLGGLLVHYFYKNTRQHGLKEMLREPKIRFVLLWNGFLWITVLLQPANLLWHMGSYVCFPVRYGYMLVAAFLCLIKMLEESLTEAGKNPAVSRVVEILLSFGAAVLLAGAVILLKSKESEIVSGFLSLTISAAYTKEACIVLIILLLIFAAVMMAVMKRKNSFPMLLIAAAVCSYCYFNMISLPAQFRENQELSYQMMAEQYRGAKQTDLEELLERHKQNTAFPRNAALIDGESSLSGYFPTADANFQSTMEKLGYLTPWVSTIDIGGTKISDFFFSHAFYVKGEAADFSFAENLPLENQQILLEMILSYSMEPQELSSIFEIILADRQPDYESGNMVLTLEEASTVYLDASETADKLQITVNGEAVTPPMIQMHDHPHALICLGTYPGGKVRISLRDTMGEACSLEQVKIGILKENQWSAALEKAETLFPADKIAVNSKGFHCGLSVSEDFTDGVLILPLNAAKGWSAKTDSAASEVLSVGGCFLGIEMKEGEHTLELTFVPPYFKVGALISLLGILLQTFLFVFRSSNAYGMILRTVPFTEKLFFCIFWGAVLMIYVIPAVGLAVSILLRLIR